MQVTDEDRKAAAEIYQNRRDHDMHKWILDGRCDADPIVQAFARHRLLGYQQGMEEAAVVLLKDDARLAYEQTPAHEREHAFWFAADYIRAKAEEKKHGTR